MKEIISATISNLIRVFHPLTFLCCCLLIGIACTANYYLNIRLWPQHNSFFNSFFFLLFLFGIFFNAGLAFTLLNKKIKPAWASPHKWILMTAPVLFALKVCLPYNDLIKDFSPALLSAFHKVPAWVGGFAFIIPVLLFIHYLSEGTWRLYYTKRTTQYRLYWLLLLFMIPLLVFASSQEAFQGVYPRSGDIEKAFHTSAKPWHYILFEISYAMDFFTIELFFRGFLIATLSRILGVYAIVPIALFYFAIHLGKPMLEAISSFFGGLVLGAVSYQTKSIWGGWIVHCGIALLMELFGYIF